MVLQNLWQWKMYISQQCIICQHNGHTYILNCENMKNDPCELVQLLLSSTHLPLTKSIVFSPHLSHPFCLCRTALWAVASQVTWANRRLYIPAEHSFALRGFPPLSHSPGPLFVSVHSCTEASNSSRGLTLLSDAFFSVCCFIFGLSQKGCCILVLNCSDLCAILHLVALAKFLDASLVTVNMATIHWHCQLDIFVKNTLPAWKYVSEYVDTD